MSSNIVTRVRYKKGNNFQALVGGWCKYVDKDHGADGTPLKDLSTSDKEFLKEFGIYDESNENEEIHMWGKNGDVTKKDILKNLSRNNPGRMWNLVISFPPDFAIQNNLKTKYDYYLLTKNVIPKFIIDNNLDITNTNWYSALHIDTDNPHLHICIFEKEQRRKKDTLEKSAMKSLKSNIASFLVDNTKYYTERDFIFLGLEKKIRDKNLTSVKDELFFTSKYRRNLNKDLLNLYNKLPKKGRLQYNSKNMKPYKEDLNKIIEKILYHDTIKYEYEKYYHSLEKLEREQKRLYGNSKNNKYVENKINQLYAKIGNDILRNFKVYNSTGFIKHQKEFLKANIKNMNFKSKNIKKKSTVLKCVSYIYQFGKLAGLTNYEIKGLVKKWAKNSNITDDPDLLFTAAKKNANKVSVTDFYKGMSKLGYTKERYDNLKAKSFYKNIRFKQFMRKANNYLIYETKEKEKYLMEILEEELNRKEY